jgi:diguanylate cyclase (GGDEF)-like protein
MRFSCFETVVIPAERHYSESAGFSLPAAKPMTTTVLIGISVALGALVVLLLALLVVRWRSDTSTDERVAEVVASLNARMDELGQELAGALERAEEEGRRSRIFGELAGSIDLDEVLSRTLEAAGALGGADAALVMLPDPQGGKPLVATLGLSVEEAERHAITGPPDGRLARSITMSYTYPELEREAQEDEDEGIIHAGLAVPLPGETGTLGYLTVFTRSKGYSYSDEEVRQLETLALRAGPAIENARRFREARQLADLDALTGLHNRRFFHETLSRECARAHRYERKLSLIIFDLDDFKEINDRIGHLAGDGVLAEAAERVRGVVRTADVACRVGGDEFGVILPESSIEDADQLYRRIQNAVSSRPIGHAGKLFLSAGVAELRAEDDPVSFFQRADDALYRAKEAGKGRVVAATAPKLGPA